MGGCTGDGLLDANEVLKAFTVYEEQVQATATGTMPFASFPIEVQSRLEKFDESGDKRLDGVSL